MVSRFLHPAYLLLNLRQFRSFRNQKKITLNPKRGNRERLHGTTTRPVNSYFLTFRFIIAFVFIVHERRTKRNQNPSCRSHFRALNLTTKLPNSTKSSLFLFARVFLPPTSTTHCDFHESPKNVLIYELSICRSMSL